MEKYTISIAIPTRVLVHSSTRVTRVGISHANTNSSRSIHWCTVMHDDGEYFLIPGSMLASDDTRVPNPLPGLAIHMSIPVPVLEYVHVLHVYSFCDTRYRYEKLLLQYRVL